MMTDAHDLVLLRDALTGGRITLGEFADRASGAVDTRVDTLPTHREEPVDRRAVVSVLGTVRSRMRGMLPVRTRAYAVLGAASLDLSDARIDGDEVLVVARAMLGTVKIHVPRGIAVETSALPILGTCKDSATTLRDALPGSPVVRIRCVALLGTVKVLPA